MGVSNVYSFINVSKLFFCFSVYLYLKERNSAWHSRIQRKTGQLELEKENILAFELLSNGVEDLLQINGLKTLRSHVLSKKFPGLCILCSL